MNSLDLTKLSPSGQEQMVVFYECLRLFEERNTRYKDLWKADGWRGSLFSLKHKVKRLWQQFWIDNAKDKGTKEKPELDDAYDAINYIAFFIRNVQANNENGSW